MRSASVTPTAMTQRPTTSLSVQRRRRERSNATTFRRASTTHTRATGDDGDGAAGDVRDYFFTIVLDGVKRDARDADAGRDA
jgi:hypothetical protein